MPRGEGFGDVFLFDKLALRSDAKLVHVIAAQHGRGIGVLAARIGINLGVEHEHLHIRPVLQNHFRDVLEADVAQRAIAADHPYLGQLADFLVGH